VLFGVVCVEIKFLYSERAMICKGTIAAYFKLLSPHSSSENEENHEIIISRIARNQTQFLTGKIRNKSEEFYR
jgi:hypothetical protein